MINSLLVEIMGILLYLVTLYVAYKIKKIDFLIYITVFAIIFENLNVLLFAGMSSGYFYSDEFLIYIFKTPLFVFLDWAILVFGAYLLSLRLKMSKASRLFFIPLFVVVVDFVIEGISVSLGFWTWSDVVGGGTLFSLIPPSNFAGWIGVVFGFMLCYEFLERKWLSMFLGYVVFLGVAVFMVSVSRIFGLADDNYLSAGIIFLIFVLGFLYFYHKDESRGRGKSFFYDKWVVGMRGAFYVYALWFWFVGGHYVDVIYDLVLGVVLILEVYFWLRFYGVLRKRI